MTLLIHEVLAGALFYSVFCRSVKTCSRTTQPDVLLALWVLGCISIAMIATPLLTSWRPDWLFIALTSAVVTLQWVTAQHWRDGVPEQFRRPSHENCV